VTIPLEALVLHGQQHVVYVLDGANHVHVRPVEVGIEGSKLAEIKNGLNAGDRVIIGGQDTYREGEAVDPQTASAPASETQQETGGMIDLKGEDQSDGQAGAQKSPAAQPAAKTAGGGAR
jgi:hypothetical protein